MCVAAGVLGRGFPQLPAVLQDKLRGAVPLRPLLRAQAARVLPPVLRGRLHRTQAVRLSGEFTSVRLAGRLPHPVFLPDPKILFSLPTARCFDVLPRHKEDFQKTVWIEI